METIDFRPLKETDFPMMHTWLNTDFVIEWFEKGGMSKNEIKEKFTPYITGEKPTQAFIIVIDGTEAGYIQTYFIKDYLDYNEYVAADDSAAGVDLFIGNKLFLHKGLGEKIMKAFLSRHVFSNPLIHHCIIGPEPKNAVAIRMYEKAGFRWYKNIHMPEEDEPEYLMMLGKEDFCRANR